MATHSLGTLIGWMLITFTSTEHVRVREDAVLCDLVYSVFLRQVIRRATTMSLSSIQ